MKSVYRCCPSTNTSPNRIDYTLALALDNINYLLTMTFDTCIYGTSVDPALQLHDKITSIAMRLVQCNFPSFPPFVLIKTRLSLSLITHDENLSHMLASALGNTRSTC
jgi:hypothetical protein